MSGYIAINKVAWRPYSSTPDAVARRRIFPLTKDQAHAQLEALLRARPQPEPPPTRWCLRQLLSACQGVLAVKTLRGLLGVLRRLGISRQRARAYVHSPDAEYGAKLAAIQSVLAQCDNHQQVLVFADQLTYYRQPSIGPDYAPQKDQPQAPWAYGANTSYRIGACLNPFDGRVTALQRSKLSVTALVELYTQLRAAYPQAQTIYVVLDNWPVHFHPNVLAALEPQRTAFELVTPANWGQVKVSTKYQGLGLPIQLLPLPTYASWLNPIEKLWKYLKKELLHNHRLAAQAEPLKARLGAMLAGFSLGSRALLSYCGLLNPKGIYAKALKVNSALN